MLKKTFFSLTETNPKLSMDVDTRKRPRAPYKKRASVARRQALKKRRVYRANAMRGMALFSTTELKDYMDYGDVGVGSTGQIWSLSDPSIGTAYNQRIGHKIILKSLAVKFGVTVADTTNFIRILIFRWLAPAVPALADVLHYTDTEKVCFAPINVNNRDKVQTIRNEVIPLTTNAHAAEVGQFYHGFAGSQEAVWKIAGGIKDSGQVYLLAVTDSGAVSHPTFTFVSHLRYYG